MSDHFTRAGTMLTGVAAPPRIHWWFVCSSALVILLFMGFAGGAVVFACRTNDNDGLIGLMVMLITAMLLYPLMPVYAEIVQDRRGAP